MKNLLKANILSAVLTTSVAIQSLCAAENVIRDYTLRDDLSAIMDEKAKIKAMDAGDPYGSAVEKALDLAHSEEENKKLQANKATELAQNAEVAKAMRAQQAKSKSRSDAMLNLDSSFSLFIQALLDYRNRLTICPHMMGMMGQPVLPYGYYVKDADHSPMDSARITTVDGITVYDVSGFSSMYSARLTAEDDAANLQLAAFTLTALLSQLNADLDAPKPDPLKITRSFNAILQQAKDMTKLLRSTEEYSYLSIFNQVIKGAYVYDSIKREYGYDGLDAKINNVKKAIQDADANEKDKALGRLFDTFLGGLAAVGIQAAGTAAVDPMVGMTAGSAASEFGSSVGNLISGPIIKNSEIQRQNQQIEKYGSIGAFNSASLTLLATSMELGKQLFQELWINQWENTANKLVHDCIDYCSSLRTEIEHKLKNLQVAPSVNKSNRDTAINNVFVDILARVQNLVDDIKTVIEIAEDESLANSSSAFNKLLGEASKTTALQAVVNSLQDSITGPISLNALLNSLFANWQGDDKKDLQGFQAASGDIESIKGSYSIGEPNMQDDNEKLEKAIAGITTIKFNISKISGYLRDTLYPTCLNTFYSVADNLRIMANDEIKNANMALVKASPLIVGDVVTNEQNLLMVLSTNTLSVSLANQWATAMRDTHTQYTENLSLDSLSLVIQYAFSTDTDGRIRAYNYMTQSYPQFAELGDYKVIAPMLSDRISNTFSLLSRLPKTKTDVSDTIAQMQADLDNLNSWIDAYVADAKKYLNT
ncbi:MAG: hypothetical protein WCN27_00525 [Alphaproteobacteria bacterium]